MQISQILLLLRNIVFVFNLENVLKMGNQDIQIYKVENKITSLQND